MAGGSETRRVLGLILVVVGIGLVIWGYQMSGSIGSELSEAVTGAETDGVMIRYIAGAAGIVVGLFLLARK